MCTSGIIWIILLCSVFYQLCMTYKSTVRLMLTYHNFGDFVCRTDQEGWAALVACVTCILLPNNGRIILDTHLLQYIDALADACNVSVPFGADVDNGEQHKLTTMARGVWTGGKYTQNILKAGGGHRIHVWRTDMCCPAVMRSVAPETTTDEYAQWDGTTWYPELQTWAALCNMEAVRATTIVMTADTGDSKRNMITKLNASTQAIVDAFFRVKPRDNLQTLWRECI